MPKIMEFVRRLEASCGFDAGKYGDGKGGAFDFSAKASLLNISLSAAVPMWCRELRTLEKRLGSKAFADHVSRRAKECSDYVAEHGDALMFRVKGKSAKAFNRLAEGIAIMSFYPGGVTAFGTHWEYKKL